MSWGCGGCEKRMTGSSTCHCSGVGCHETFGGEGSFVKHRTMDGCKPVAEFAALGLAIVRPGVWGRRYTGSAPFGAQNLDAQSAMAGVAA